MDLEAVIQRPIEALLPHAAPMVLLDRCLSISPERFEAEVTLAAESPFCVGHRVGAWVGIEYMAQAVAAFAGAEAIAAGLPVKVGFLLGSRHYESRVPYFYVGSHLRVAVKKVLAEENGLGALDCQIYIDGSLEAQVQATLTVFQVEDLGSFLKKSVA
jgi:predicted hotdog family 3-hydroxylacyl-ACP dehydratase